MVHPTDMPSDIRLSDRLCDASARNRISHFLTLRWLLYILVCMFTDRKAQLTVWRMQRQTYVVRLDPVIQIEHRNVFELMSTKARRSEQICWSIEKCDEPRDRCARPRK